MTAPKGIEQRREFRDSRFRDGISCTLIPTDRDEITIPLRPLDVSRRGLGFFCGQALESGAFFWLVIGEARFRVELAYCSNHLGIDDLYRCGLFLREADGDLKRHCIDAGLMTIDADDGVD